MPKYKIVIKFSVKKQLKSLPVNLQKRLENKIDILADDPRPSGCKKLSGYQNKWRIRVGDYRIIYSIDDQLITIYILTIGHRSAVYEDID